MCVCVAGGAGGGALSPHCGVTSRRVDSVG